MPDVEDFKHWSPASQEKALELLQQHADSDWRPFYCPRRRCDGQAHGTGDGWDFPHARADQHPPRGESWLSWLFLAGRGAGKTLSGARWSHKVAEKYPKCRLALIAPTSADVRDTLINGESGILATARPGFVPQWEPSKRRLTWPNGSIATGFSGEEPNRLRGPQHHFCFPAGTLVSTEQGEVPIEDVRVGDLVWTRAGLRPVEAAAVSPVRSLLSISHERGSLTCTPDHPIWVNGAWTEARLVKPTDIVAAWHSTGDPTPRATTTGTNEGARSTSTAESGKTSTDPSRRGGTSITETTTEATTTSATSSPCPPASTWTTTTTSSSREPTSSSVRPAVSSSSANSGADGLSSARPARAGTLNGSDGAGPLPARSAALRSRPVLADSAVSDVSTSGEATVYNLQVAGESEFFADGVLVHNCWIDEPAHISLMEDVWSNMLFGLRLGKNPHVLLTTSPLPSKWLKEVMADDTTRVTRATTYDNIKNLPPHYAQIVLQRYEGTRLGRQEVMGELLDEIEGALWSTGLIDDNRYDVLPELTRIVVGVDPAGTAGKKSDETGIVVCGVDEAGEMYVLADYSGKYSPEGWARKSIDAASIWKADALVVEITYGRDMVTSVLHNSKRHDEVLPRISTVDSRRGKQLRAEPIVALYEKERIHHGSSEKLETMEDQMLTWVPGRTSSPDRVDALVHALTDLAKTAAPSAICSPFDLMRYRQTA